MLTPKKGNVCLETLLLRLFHKKAWLEQQGPGLCAPNVMEMTGNRYTKCVFGDVVVEAIPLEGMV